MHSVVMNVILQENAILAVQYCILDDVMILRWLLIMDTFRVWWYTWSWKVIVCYEENTCYFFIQGIHNRDMLGDRINSTGSKIKLKCCKHSLWHISGKFLSCFYSAKIILIVLKEGEKCGELCLFYSIPPKSHLLHVNAAQVSPYTLWENRQVFILFELA